MRSATERLLGPQCSGSTPISPPAPSSSFFLWAVSLLLCKQANPTCTPETLLSCAPYLGYLHWCLHVSSRSWFLSSTWSTLGGCSHQARPQFPFYPLAHFHSRHSIYTYLILYSEANICCRRNSLETLHVIVYCSPGGLHLDFVVLPSAEHGQSHHTPPPRCYGWRPWCLLFLHNALGLANLESNKLTCHDIAFTYFLFLYSSY